MMARHSAIRATGVVSIFGAAGPALDEIGLSAWIAQAEPGEAGMNAMYPKPASRTATPCPTNWPAERLAEARGIVADCVHHPDSLIILACRAIAAHSPDPEECREALALAGLLVGQSARTAKAGVA